MSLDLSVTVDGETREMNWLRNPFGLCDWAEDNVKPGTRQSLYYVCNHWSYNKSQRVNKKLFLDVVLAYSEAIKVLEKGYFVFDLPSYRQFVEPNIKHLPTDTMVFTTARRIVGSKYDDKLRLMIPMEYFSHSVFNIRWCKLADYQAWFQELVELAELLQQPRAKFYCSN